MPPTVEFVNSRLDGLSLTPSTHDTFDQQLSTMFGADTPLFSSLKPYLMIGSNESAHTIVGYRVLFKVTWNNGQIRRNPTGDVFPDAIVSNLSTPHGREIRSGGHWLVGFLFQWKAEMTDDRAHWTSAFRNYQETYFKDAHAVEVGLDAVLYDDGFLAGPDTTGLADSFMKHLRAQQELYQRLLKSSAPRDLLRSIRDKVLPGPNLELPETEIPPEVESAVVETVRLFIHFGDQLALERMRAVQDEAQKFRIHREHSD